MYSLTISFGMNGQMPWVFLYKTEETAKQAAQSKTNTAWWHVTDDFGQEGQFRVTDIHGILLENLELSKMAHVERGLHNLRTQIKADQMADADPTVKTARMRQGAAMLTPFANGARPLS